MILLTVLWVVILLSIMALGISRRVNVELALTKLFIGKDRAYYAARSGVVYAKSLIRADSAHKVGGASDTRYQCGLTAEIDEDPSAILQNVPVGEKGYFDIAHPEKHFEDIRARPGMRDEERKININALTVNNYQAFTHLIMQLGYDRQTAETISAAALDWKDPDSVITDEPRGDEGEGYAYAAKNRPFDQIEELLLVKGVTPDILEHLADVVTVFPQQAEKLLVNFNTAPDIVLTALAGFVNETTPGFKLNSSEGIVQKILSYRDGPDRESGTADDQLLSIEGNVRERYGFSASEENVYRRMVQTFHTPVSHYIRVRVSGHDTQFDVTASVETVIKRDDMSIVYWDKQ